jgi:hypothetical protein
LKWKPQGGKPRRQTTFISSRLPKRLAEPKRITSYVYNGDGGVTCGATGAMCSKMLTETTDANGSLGFRTKSFRTQTE